MYIYFWTTLYFVRCTDHEAPRYVVFSSSPLPRLT